MTDDEALRPGGIAADSDDDGSVLVTLFEHGSSAEDYRIAATGKSVAQHNPEYDPADAVWVCAYRGTIEEAFGDKWRNWSTERLAFEAGNRGCRTYSFPAGRLDPKPHGWSPDDETDDRTDDIREYL